VADQPGPSRRLVLERTGAFPQRPVGPAAGLAHEPARELGHRNPVKLAHGVRGWVGSVGCGFNPGPGWGPVYCGMNVIVWHADGINYAIQEPDADNSLLITYADQMIRHG